MRYADRRAAGLALAGRLLHLAGRPEVIVLGLPRGGVPVAAEVAGQLGAPLDVLVVRKLGVPWHRELAMGAIAPGGVRVLQERVIQRTGIRPYQVEAATEREAAELLRQQELYRAGHTFVGHLRGGLAMATVLACAGFGAICGSSIATAATARLAGATTSVTSTLFRLRPTRRAGGRPGTRTCCFAAMAAR